MGSQGVGYNWETFTSLHFQVIKRAQCSHKGPHKWKGEKEMEDRQAGQVPGVLLNPLLLALRKRGEGQHDPRNAGVFWKQGMPEERNLSATTAKNWILLTTWMKRKLTLPQGLQKRSGPACCLGVSLMRSLLASNHRRITDKPVL